MIRRSLLLLVLHHAIAHAAIDVDMFVGSTAPGGGQLAMAYAFCRPIVVSPQVSVGGMTRWTGTQPGFNALETSRPGQLYVLRNSIPIEVEAVALDPGVAFKIGAVVLDAPGTVAPLGNIPNIHVHPEWRLLLPDGQTGVFGLSFRLKTDAAGYGESPTYRLTITNVENPPDQCGSATTTTTLPAQVVEHLVTGQRLQLRASPQNATRKVLVLDLAAPFAAADGVDPTTTGATLRLLSNAGDGFEARYDLEEEHWRLRRPRRPSAGFVYHDPEGPIRSAVLIPGGAVHVVGRGGELIQSIGQSPDPVDVTLAVGGARACARFGGTVHFAAGRRYDARSAPAPDACAR